MNFTVEYLEYILLVFIRVASVVFVAPFFGSSEIPRRVKVAIAFFLSLTVMNQVDYKAVEYAHILEYSGLVLKKRLPVLLLVWDPDCVSISLIFPVICWIWKLASRWFRKWTRQQM